MLEETKPILTSKTVITNLILAVFAALAFFGVLPAALTQPETVGAIGVLGNLAAAWFRKTATTALG